MKLIYDEILTYVATVFSRNKCWISNGYGENAASCKSPFMRDLVKSSGNASRRTGRRPGARARARSQRRRLKSLKKRQARRNHVYFLMAAQGNRCIGGGPGVLC